MYNLLKALKVYGVLVLFLAGWWTLAFRQNELPTATGATYDAAARDTSLQQTSPSFSLADMPRDTLQKALAGDLTLMARLMAEWDIDAKIMHADGLHAANRLSPADFLRSQTLHRQLQNSTPQQLIALAETERLPYLVDDSGKPINLSRPFHGFLPQTYAAASFLLALAPVSEIVALPGRLREQEHLYPRTLTDQIPLDIDRYNAEKLFLAHPEVAFVAHYSHPATLEALANQGVILYTMQNPDTLHDITIELMHIGQIINRPLEAELLSLFISAAMLALDNRLLILSRQLDDAGRKPPRLLFLNYHQNFSIPTKKTLTGQLLQRLGAWDISLPYAAANAQSHEWMVSIDKERLLNLNPDWLIVAAENRQTIHREMHQDPALMELAAIRQRHLYFVDESIQHSPSQYIVLAYYDIIQALMELP